MATEIVATDHTSTTDEQFEKKENQEVIEQKSVPLANEDEDKSDTPVDAQDLATNSSNTGEKSKGEEKSAEVAAVKVEKCDDSPPLEASAEDNNNNPKHDKVEDAKGSLALISKTEAKEDNKNDEPAVVEENLKEEKELIPDSESVSFTEPANDADKSQPEEPKSTEPTLKDTPQTEGEKQLKTAEPSEKSSNIAEGNPVTESEAEVVKESATLKTSSQKVEKLETVITEVHEEPEKEYQGQAQGDNQLGAVATEDSSETNEKLSDATEEKTREPETETEKAEPVVTEVEENPKEPEKKSAPTVTEKAEPLVTEVEENPIELEKQSGPPETEKAEPVVSETGENPKGPEEQTCQRAQEEQPTTAAISEPSTDTNDEIGEPKLEEGPAETEKGEPGVAKVGESPSQPDEPSLKQEVEEQPAAIPESSTDTSDAGENQTREPELDAEALEKTHNYEAGPAETQNAEPVVTEGAVIPGEPETTLFEQAKEEQPVAIPEPSSETSDAIDQKTREAELEAEVLVEKTQAGPTETEKAEPVVAKVVEIPNQPEEPSFDQMKEEQPLEIPKSSAESSDIIEVKTREEEHEAEALMEKTHEYEAGPTEIDKAEPAVAKVGESQSQPEEPSLKQEEEEQLKTVIPETASESAEKPGDSIEIHPSRESDIEVVKEIDNSDPEAEKPEPPSTGEKPKEQLVVAEEVGETGKVVETEEKSVLETTKNEATSSDSTNDPILLKEEKTAQVSLNVEAQAVPRNVEGDGKKEPSFTEVAEGVTQEVVGVWENREQASIDQKAETGLKEKTDYSSPTTIEEKIATNDEKKELEPPNAIQGTPREVEVITKKVEENNEAKIATTELKVEEIAKAPVSEPVGETLASKFDEKEEQSFKTGVDNLEKEQTEQPVKTEVHIAEQPTKESDAAKTSKEVPKETPAKPAQKQSNNLISKVKQSLVKAKKAITGKSPSSKNGSSEAKDDIKVK